MTGQIDLKDIERKAFRSTYQDGLWDVYLGLIVVCMSVFVYRPADGYSAANILLAILMVAAARALFWAGKKYVTLPRMGQVRFGAARRRRKATLAIFLAALVALQTAVVGLTALAWIDPTTGAWVNSFFATRSAMDLAVAVLGALFVGTGMLLMAFFSDFARGYYIALLMSLAVFLMVYVNQPVFPIILGGLIVLHGLALFVRFLRAYPLPREEPAHE
jgi:hypothetical protein